MVKYDIRIKIFRVKGFRIFKDETFSFDKSTFYSFIGRNATGKTTVLEAMNIALSENSSKFNHIEENDFYSDEPIELSIEFTKPFFIAYEDGTGFQRLLPCQKFVKTIKRRDRKAAGQFFSSPYVIDLRFDLILYSHQTKTEHERRFGEYQGLIPSKSIIVYSLEKDQQSDDYRYTIGSDRIGDDREQRWVKQLELLASDRVLFPKVFYFDKDRDRELVAQYNTAFSNIVEELNWRYRKEFLKEENKQTLIGKYHQLHEAISDLSEYKTELLLPAKNLINNEFGLDFDIDNLDFYFLDYDQPFNHTTFGLTTTHQRLIDVRHFGSGISILVALAILVAFAEESKNPIIILIDEPELHLHADLQKNLRKFLENKNFQTFVATHSHLFVDKKCFGNNILFKRSESDSITVEFCNPLILANLLFELLGHSMDDLYIPENLILMEGSYDKQVLAKCLSLLGAVDRSLLLLDCGGYTEIPVRGDAINDFFETHFDSDFWYDEYIHRNFRLIVDGDVSKDRVRGWKNKFQLPDEKVKHLDEPSLEYLYPGSLVKKVVQGLVLKDGSPFELKTKDEIIKIILDDEKLRNHAETENEIQQSKEQIISKQRLTEFIVENLDNDILNNAESSGLLGVTQWIVNADSVELIPF